MMSHNKSELRRVLLAYRQTLAVELQTRWNAAICDRLETWLVQDGPSTLGVYAALPGEPDLQALYRWLVQRGVRLALPVVAAPNAPLDFVEWTLGESLVNGAFQVAVPLQQRRIDLPQCLLIPCLGFNEQRLRLGYGGGFYDRTLAVWPRPLTIGVAYSETLRDFAAQPHDIALDVIVTEKAFLGT